MNELEQKEVLQGLLREISHLPKREQSILVFRFGLNDGIERTLKWIGQRMGISKERVRQIELRALNLLRHPERSKRFLE